MKALVVINPSSRRNSHGAVRKAVDRCLRSAGVVCTLHTTRAGEDLSGEVRRRLADGIDVVLAAGGDGTVSSVLDGLMGSDVPLSIVPVGTGNLIARDLGVPNDVDAAVGLVLANPRPLKLDVMRINTRVFVLNAGVGLSAAVVQNTTRTQKRRLGFAAYVAATIAKLLFTRPRRLEVVVDGKPHSYRAVEVMVNNCGILARRLYPRAPDIRMDDGQLDVWVMSTEALFDYPRYLLATITGRTPHLGAAFLRAEHEISILSKTPLPVQADGDIIGTTPVNIELLPGAVTVLAPQLPAQNGRWHQR